MRTYIRPDLTIAGFFEALRRDRCKYVVLRWFEDLPHLEPGEDIDLLVDEDSLDHLLANTDRSNKRGVPLDIYSPSGERKTDWAQTTVYPRRFSETILNRRVVGTNGVWRPREDDYFRSLAYHAVFHKGLVSGLPIRPGAHVDVVSDHDYLGILQSRAESAGLAPENITLTGLYTYFEGGPDFPNPDMMDMIVRRNTWLAEVWRDVVASVPEPWPQIAVFVVRERGIPELEKIRRKLSRSGFFVAAEKALDSNLAVVFSAEVRGGDWGKGPYPESGGPPRNLIVCFDPYPEPPSESELSAQPLLQNARESQAKSLIRKSRNLKKHPSQWANIIHSSDNGLNAKRYCELVMSSEEIAQLVESASEYAKRCEPPPGVSRRLDSGAVRAVLYESDSNGFATITKVFKPDRLQYFERELWVRNQLGTYPGVVPIHERGPHWFSMPRLPLSDLTIGTLTPREVIEVVTFVRHLRAHGIEAIDFLPQNLARDEQANLWFMDFEYFQQSPASEKLRGALAFYDSRKGGAFELPMGYDYGFYNKKWLPVLRIPRWMLSLQLPEWAIATVQKIVEAQLNLLKVASALFRLVRKIRKRLSAFSVRKLRRRVGNRIDRLRKSFLG